MFNTSTIFHKINTSQRLYTADACSCDETLREARKRTKEKRKEPREMVFPPDPSLLLLRSLFLVYPIDWSPILTEAALAFDIDNRLKTRRTLERVSSYLSSDVKNETASAGLAAEAY